MADICHGCFLVQHILNNIEEEHPYKATLHEIRQTMREVDEIANAHLESFSAPQGLLDMVGIIQMTQVCIQITLAWRANHPSSSEEAPQVIAIRSEKDKTRVRRRFDTSDETIQAMLQARPLASRGSCA